jgi:hypothetical protein
MVYYGTICLWNSYKLFRKGFKSVRNGSEKFKWFCMVQYGLKWFKMVLKCFKWYVMMGNVLNWFNMGSYG